MPAATAINVKDRPGGHHYTGTFTLDPGAIAAGGSEKETVAVKGVTVDDVAYVSPQVSPAAGIIIGFVRCSADQIEFSIENNSAGALDLASQLWNFGIIRGTTGPLR